MAHPEDRPATLRPFFDSQGYENQGPILAASMQGGTLKRNLEIFTVEGGLAAENLDVFGCWDGRWHPSNWRAFE